MMTISPQVFNEIASLLLDDDYIRVPVRLATLIGLNEAIVLRKIHEWVKYNQRKESSRHLWQGYYWTYQDYEDLQKEFPWWSVKTVQRTINSLEKSGLLVSAQVQKPKGDRTKWYRVDVNKLVDFHLKTCDASSGQNDFTPSGQNDLMHQDKLTCSSSGQNDLMHQDKLTCSYNESITNNQITNTFSNAQTQNETREREEERTGQEWWSNPDEVAIPGSLDSLATKAGTTRLTSQPTLEDNYGAAAQPEVSPTLTLNNIHPAEKMETRFRNELPEWRNSRKRNDYAIALIDYLQTEYLPKKSTLHKDQEVMRGEACSWISKREMTEAGLAEIEARLMDAKEWASKRSQREAIAQRMRGEEVTVEAIAAPAQEAPQNLDEVLLNSVLDRLIENPSYVPSQGILKRLKKPIEWVRAEAEKLKARRA